MSFLYISFSQLCIAKIQFDGYESENNFYISIFK